MTAAEETAAVAFLEACDAALTGPAPAAGTFATLVAAMLSIVNDGGYYDLRARFEVAVSTVVRWANGQAVPHPAIQRQIIREMASLMTRRLLAAM